LVTAYLLKGIRTGKPQMDNIMKVKINDFNLVDRKNFSMIAPHRYLTRMKGKKSRIIPQPWTMDLVIVHHPERNENTPFWKAVGG
jgi:hypothetical protein